MAVNYRDVEIDDKDKTSETKLSLTEEVRRARRARNKLAYEKRHSDMNLERIERLLGEQKDSQEKLVTEFRNGLQELEKIRKEMRDVSYLAEQMAISGVSRASEQAEKLTLQHLDAIQDQYVMYVQTLVEQAQVRTQKLRKSVDKRPLLSVLTILLLLMNVLVLGYVMWIK